MLNISVGGDAAGGYIVDVHDGEKYGVYRPENVTDDGAALVSAIKEHDPQLAVALSKAFGSDPAEAAKLEAANGRIDTLMGEKNQLADKVASLEAKIAEMSKPPAPPPAPPPFIEPPKTA